MWPYVKNSDVLFPKQEAKAYYNFSNNDEQEWFVKEILAHKWTNNDLEIQVKWTLGDVTWEPISSCKDLEALDKYLELQGVKHASDPPQLWWSVECHPIPSKTLPVLWRETECERHLSIFKGLSNVPDRQLYKSGNSETNDNGM